jgi:cell division protein FtsI (penicillin-binding protein 3)
MKPTRVTRSAIVHGALALFAAALVLRAAKVQLLDGAQWRERAARQHFDAADLPAPRGAIRDATGRTLVESRELVALAVAPREVAPNRRGVVRRVLVQNKVSRAVVAKAIDKRQKWVPIPGRFLPSAVAPLLGLRGVHATPVVQREMVPAPGIRRIVGRVDADGEPLDGIELSLDTLLRGTRGTRSEARDGRGRRFGTPAITPSGGRPGHAVTLTINFTLQDIAERALADAVTRMGATGGDIVIMDPRDGALLAMASRRPDPRATAATAFSEPFEPGSTIKPFVAARLLDLGRATPDEVVRTFNGELTLEGRTIHDSHKAERMTLREVIAFSSNVGIVQFAQRLNAREQYELLRDAGFGSATGAPYPAESPGRLYEPGKWSRQSPASLAMGYELSVNAVQLAAAYAAIANGGELLEPAFVRAVHDGAGARVFEHRRRVVRRLMTPETSRIVRDMLVQTVTDGSAVEADLATFQVGGKTGTARRVTAGQGYKARSYTATYVGMFPARDPKYIILVKIDDPDASQAYYGGKTAAPVSKLVLEAAIAARDAVIDRGVLAQRDKVPAESLRPVDGAPRVAVAATVDTSRPPTYALEATPPAPAEEDTSVPFVVTLPATATAAAKVAPPPRVVPDVHGLPLRAAVTQLHRAGFRVELSRGPQGLTTPAAGALARPGALVHLFVTR